MKLKLCFLLLLCQIFCAGAQDRSKIRPLSVGDKVPDILLSGVSNLFVSGKPVRAVRLSQFAGKLLIIDFWATWCSPCRGMIPVMDSLQRVFAGKVQFLPVTYQSALEIKPVISAIRKYRDFDLPEVTGDKVLHALFPHRTLPHYVWVDGTGTVVAITELKEVTGDNIRRFLNKGKLDVAVKKDAVVAYDSSLPLFVNGNGGDGTGVRYHSLLGGYVPGLKPGLQVTPYDTLRGQRFMVRNVPFIWLCRLVFGEKGRHFSDAVIKVFSKDSSRMNSRLTGSAYDKWLGEGNAYTYELMVPPGLTGCAYPMMQQDLVRLFPQYNVTVETQVTRCLALVLVGNEDLIRTSGGTPLVAVTPYSCRLVNSHLNQLFIRLQHQYLQNLPIPLIDDTGYSGRVDISFDCKLFDVASLNGALRKYGLALVEKDAPVEMLVIRDNPITFKP